MKSRSALIAMLLALSAPLSCADEADCASLDSLAWMTGSWADKTGNSYYFERWWRVSADTMEGVARTRDAATGARGSGETLRLVAMGGQVFFLAKVASNEYPVPFALTRCAAGVAVFANPQHDFPRLLDYRLQPDGRLHVQVSDGGEKGFELWLSPVTEDNEAS